MKYRNYWGYEIDLLVAMSETLNFTYTIVNPEDGKWGHIEADGTWSGLVAEAAFARVDFVICDIFLVYSRWQVTFQGQFTSLLKHENYRHFRFLMVLYPLTRTTRLLLVLDLCHCQNTWPSSIRLTRSCGSASRSPSSWWPASFGPSPDRRAKSKGPFSRSGPFSKTDCGMLSELWSEKLSRETQTLQKPALYGKEFLIKIKRN